MNLIEKLQQKNRDRNVVFIAIEELNSNDEIKQFHSEYKQYMVDEGFDHKVADSNIGYVLGYYDKTTRDSWMKLLDASHPVFGKEY